MTNPQPLFRREAIAAASTRVFGGSVLYQPPRLVITVVCCGAIFIGVLSFCFFAKITDIHSARGVLTYAEATEVFATSNPGDFYEAVLVSENGAVETGDILAYIASTNVSGSTRKILTLLEETREDLTAAIALETDTFDFQTSILNQRIDDLKERIQRDSTELSYMSDLVSSEEGVGVVASANLVNHGEERSVRQRTAVNDLRLNQLQSQLADLETRLQMLPLEHASQMLEFKRRLADIEILIEERAGKIAVVAPSAGKVTEVRAVIGDRVDPDLPILSIIQSDSVLEAVVQVEGSVSNWIKIGQPVKVTLEPHLSGSGLRRFVGLVSRIERGVASSSDSGTVSWDAESAVQVYVSLTFQTNGANFVPPNIEPGMLLTAEIILAERSLLAWIVGSIGFGTRGR